VTGYYISGSTVDLGDGVTLASNSGAGSDGYVVKYNTSGVAQWSKRINGASNDWGNAIATDSTGVYVTGYYTSGSVVNLGDGVTLPNIAGTDAIIVKYNTSGVTQWASTLRGTGIDQGFGIATDSTGGVYVTGYYESSSGGTLNNGVTLPNTSSTDAFIVKYNNTSGLAQWATTISGSGGDNGRGITTDSTGVYVTGTYTAGSVVTLNNGKTLPITSPTTGNDAYIVKYNTNGDAQWATTISGTGTDQGFGIATDSTGVYVTGFYNSTSPVTLTNAI
jgi:hypothetical protein